MKKSNLFSFFTRGVTATHPLCSVFTITLLFVFCSVCVSVSADTTPSNLPYSDTWQFGQALEAYNSLTDDQKKISNFLVGCQGDAYAGLANYSFQANYLTFDSVIDSISDFGEKLWNNMKSAYQRGYEIGSGIRNKLSNFFGSSVEYASSRSESFSAWLGNVGISYNSTSEFRIGYYPESTKEYINYFGDQSLYEWQFMDQYIVPSSFNFAWRTSPMDGNAQGQYNTIINGFTNKHVRVNFDNGSYTNIMWSSPIFDRYCYVFVNTTSGAINLVDINGNIAPASSNNAASGVRYWDALGYPESVLFNVVCKTLYFGDYNNTLVELFYDLNNNPWKLVSNTTTPNYYYPAFVDFVEGLYIGESWDNKVPWNLNFDLNFAPVSNYVTVYSPNQPIYIDIIGFIKDLYDNDKTIKKSVEDNSVISDGTPLTPDIWDTISNYFTRPDSGIHIGTDFFKLPGSEFSIFDTYIADLWRNTKDFVLYCGDIFEVFTSDSGGLAYIIYGGIAIGVIGGIFSKFLL